MPATRIAGDAPDERSPLLTKRANGNATAETEAATSPAGGTNGNISVVRNELDGDEDEDDEEQDTLLRPDGTKIAPGERIAPDELEDALDPAERRRSTLRWLAFWIAFGTFTIVLVVLAIKKGGAKFGFKDALKKAAGGVGV